MAVSNQDIINWLTANPTASDAEIASVMQTAGVSPEQLSSATGTPVGEITSRLAQTLPTNQATLFGDTYVQPIYSQTGSGMDAQQGPLENVVTYKAGDNKVGGNVNWYDPSTGGLQQTTQQQKVSNSLTPFLLGSAALFGGLGSGFEGLFGGGSAADAAAAAADADIAGGLIPEYGTNAAYNSFMTAAMTPEALASLEALVAANPEILGSGALLTDAAAGLTPSVIPSGGGTSVITPTTATTTTPTVTPTTPTVPTVTPTNLTKYITPSVVASLGGLLGGTVLSKANGSGTPQTPVSVPTQGMPLNSQDYFNAIQQNYNQLMPAVPRDVATPLAAWYNSKYGA